MSFISVAKATTGALLLLCLVSVYAAPTANDTSEDSTAVRWSSFKFPSSNGANYTVNRVKVHGKHCCHGCHSCHIEAKQHGIEIRMKHKGNLTLSEKVAEQFKQYSNVDNQCSSSAGPHCPDKLIFAAHIAVSAIWHDLFYHEYHHQEEIIYRVANFELPSMVIGFDGKEWYWTSAEASPPHQTCTVVTPVNAISCPLPAKYSTPLAMSTVNWYFLDTGFAWSHSV
eukprot:Nk52_evm40s208 gene=Nk52_evmTU40s208